MDAEWNKNQGDDQGGKERRHDRQSQAGKRETHSSINK